VPTVSVIVITKNEERNIRDCLMTVRWADEIVVVDAGSTDRTVEAAREFTSKIFVRPWDGYGAAKNFALSQCVSEWVLWLDADERVTDGLQKEIRQALASVPAEVAGFSVPRLAMFLGRWIRHCGWYPGRVIRLFRKPGARFSEERVHERLYLEGQVELLHSDLLHYTDPDLTHYYEKYNRYTSLAAEELAERGVRFRILSLIVRPWWVFVRMYFLRLGFLDGIAGLILCKASAAYVFTKYAKLWERQMSRKEVGP